MPLDNVPKYPSEYDKNEGGNEPPPGDSRREGDDQFRILKANLAWTFEAISGPVLVTQDEINTLSGVSPGVALETRLKYLEDSFPIGTHMLFLDVSVPAVGWELDIAYDNRFLRVVNSIGTGFGGTHDPRVMDKIPPHNHSLGPVYENLIENACGILLEVSDRAVEPACGYVNTLNNTGLDATNWEPLYVDTIVGVRVA